MSYNNERKPCTLCGEVKEPEEFAWRDQARGRRQSSCKSCQTSYNRRHYEKYRERYLEKSARHRREVAAYVRELKSSTPCTDCRQTFPYYVMDFDHLDPGRKSFTISDKLGTTPGWATLEAEIAKCELVCANCHRVRTHKRTTGGM